MLSNLEGLCTTSCFVILFLTTIFYWSKIIFLGESSGNGLLGYTGAFIFLTIHLVLRWVDSGHFPLSNLYESLLFLAWCLVVVSIYIEKSTKTLFLGVLTVPTILCLVSFAEFSLPPELQQSHSLVPALQSNWLVMHVTVMIASYAALLLGCLMSIAFLVFFYWFPEPQTTGATVLKTSNPSTQNSESSIESENLQKEKQTPDFKLATNPELLISLENYQTLLNFLDNLSYRTIGIGFCFLTLGILSGAVWANESWGNYWSWDPKETWALITWLTFASYLHSRLIAGWQGYKPAFIGSLGFVVIWICYLGVNLFGQGLHTYGFLQI